MSLLHERPEKDSIQLARRDEVPAEGFLDDDSGPFRASRSSQLFDDGSEERGWDRQVMRGVLCAPEFASERLEGVRIFVVAVDVAQSAAQLVERGTVQAPVFLDALLRARAQLVEGPASLGHADHRNVEVAALGHRLQRRKDLLVRKVARRPEEHKRVGTCVAHLDLVLKRSLEGALCEPAVSVIAAVNRPEELWVAPAAPRSCHRARGEDSPVARVARPAHG